MSTINAVVTKKSPIAFDLFTKTLTIHEQYYKKAMIFGSPESLLVKQILSENPEYTLEIATSNKQSYKGIKLTLIKEFISYHEDKARLEAEYNSLEKADGEDDPDFPLVKKWFLKNFPKMTADKMNEYISSRKIEIAESKAKAVNNVIPHPATIAQERKDA